MNVHNDNNFEDISITDDKYEITKDIEYIMQYID